MDGVGLLETPPCPPAAVVVEDWPWGVVGGGRCGVELEEGGGIIVVDDELGVATGIDIEDEVDGVVSAGVDIELLVVELLIVVEVGGGGSSKNSYGWDR